MRLYFLRHGQSLNNSEGLYTGQQDVPLTDLGRDQARLGGQHIAAKKVTIDVIVASPLIRAFETAELVADVLHYPREKIVAEPLVMERFFGDLQGKSKKVMGKLSAELIEKSGAESDEVLYDRAQKFLASIKKTDASNVLIVSHNGFGKRISKVLQGLDPDVVWEMPDFPNAELVDLGEI